MTSNSTAPEIKYSYAIKIHQMGISSNVRATELSVVPTIVLFHFVDMTASGFVIFYRTQRVFNHVILFWVLCALNKECTQPTKKLRCEGKKLMRRQYAGM